MQQDTCESNGYAVWEDNSTGNFEIYISQCTEGQAFGIPEDISNNEGDSLLPQIAVSGDNVYVVWRDNTPGNFDIFISVRTHGGQNFSTPENISNSTGNPDLQQIAVFGDNVYVVWQDGISSDDDIFISVSTHGGQNFSTPENLSNSAETSENPQIAVFGDNVYVVWQDGISSDDDIFISVSTHGGQNFSPPMNISNTNNSSDFPQIAVSGNNVYVVWQEPPVIQIYLLL